MIGNHTGIPNPDRLSFWTSPAGHTVVVLSSQGGHVVHKRYSSRLATFIVMRTQRERFLRLYKLQRLVYPD